MSANRTKILLGVAVVLAAMLLWNWISGWGLVTVHVHSEPLSKVISSIESQGGIKIVTNADASTPVTMDVDRVPPAKAVDVLSAWMDGNWSVGYAAGPSKVDVLAGIAALQDGGRGNDGDFARFGFGGFGGGGGGGFESATSVIDARKVSWKVSPSTDQQLQSYLGQLSFKTGLMAIVPRSWNPAVTGTPSGGEAASAIQSLVTSAHGQLQEIFVIRVQSDDQDRPGGDGGGPARDGGGFAGRGGFNPDWMQDRTDARIAALPASEQEQAKKDVDTMRATWERIRSLPDDQRRAEMDKLMNDPAIQDKMMERQMARDSMRSPEKRAERMRQYIQHKQQVQAKSSS